MKIPNVNLLGSITKNHFGINRQAARGPTHAWVRDRYWQAGWLAGWLALANLKRSPPNPKLRIVARTQIEGCDAN